MSRNDFFAAFIPYLIRGSSSNTSEVRLLECQIDQMVYRLYGLTPEEIAVVEGSEKK